MEKRAGALRAVGLAVLVAVASPAPAGAEEAGEGPRLFAEARFEAAAAAFEAVLADGRASAEAVAEAHLYLAALRLMDGEAEAASGHAAAAAAIDPDLAAPPGSPVQLREMLASAGAALPAGGMGLVLDAPDCPAAGAPFRVRARLVGAPAGLVASVALHCGSEGLEAHAAGAGEGAELLVPAEGLAEGDEVLCRATARAGSDALLRAAERSLRLCPRPEPDAGSASPPAGEGPGRELPGPSPPDPDRAGGRSLARNPWLWTGVGLGAAAVVASVVLAVFLTAQPAEADLGPIRLDGP